jgi:hypothetical protein
MSQFFDCDLEQFVHAIEPLIEKYNIEKSEALSSVIHQCYQRLKQTNVNDENTIQKLIGDLIGIITDNKIGGEKSVIIIDICKTVGVKVTELKAKVLEIQQQVDQLRMEMKD